MGDRRDPILNVVSGFIRASDPIFCGLCGTAGKGVIVYGEYRYVPTNIAAEIGRNIYACYVCLETKHFLGVPEKDTISNGEPSSKYSYGDPERIRVCR